MRAGTIKMFILFFFSSFMNWIAAISCTASYVQDCVRLCVHLPATALDSPRTEHACLSVSVPLEPQYPYSGGNIHQKESWYRVKKEEEGKKEKRKRVYQIWLQLRSILLSGLCGYVCAFSLCFLIHCPFSVHTVRPSQYVSTSAHVTIKLPCVTLLKFQTSTLWWLWKIRACFSDKSVFANSNKKDLYCALCSYIV